MSIPVQTGTVEPSALSIAPEQINQREFVSKVVKDICEGRLVFRVDQQGRRPEDIELVSGTVGRLVGYINDYVSGTKAAEEFEVLEKQLFFCITVLRTYDALKPNLNEARIGKALDTLEAKMDSLSIQLEEVRKVLADRPKTSSLKISKRKKASKKTKKRSKS